MAAFRPRTISLVIAIVLMVSVAAVHAAPDSLERVSRPWKGDLSQILEKRRPLRVLVSYNRTNFFMVDGMMRGLEADLLNAYEKFLVKKHKREMVRMVFVAVPFDELFTALLDGRGDIAAAGLTITRDRAKEAAFAAPYRTGVEEILVGGFRSRIVDSVERLSGRRVHVMAGSSYEEHLKRFNKTLDKQGLDPIKIIQADPNLVTEDLLEMVAYGIIEYTFADSHIAHVWKEAVPGLRLFPDVTLHTGGKLAWAVRPSSPELKKSLSQFAATVQRGTLLGNMFFKRYYENDQYVSNPLATEDIGNLKPMADIFKKYAKMYDFDWLKIAALAYQESRFDMNRKSNQGAVGVMQIKPSTAGDPRIDIKDVYTLENNIHAGVKYLRMLCDNYFQNVHPDARVDFALAAYNAGPARIMGLQKKAAQMGLDPKRWFGNVEWAAFNAIGRETPAYVAHVQMYYAAYKASAQVLLQREEAR